VKVRITFDKLEDFILPDMGVKVAFLEEEQKAKTTEKGPRPLAFIPKSAVRSDSASTFVLLVHDGKVERRAISLGTDRGTEVAVLAGLSPGDSLVVKGPESLQDGDKVQVQQ
jgi:HlyD family secretion protein